MIRSYMDEMPGEAVLILSKKDIKKLKRELRDTYLGGVVGDYPKVEQLCAILEIDLKLIS